MFGLERFLNPENIFTLENVGKLLISSFVLYGLFKLISKIVLFLLKLTFVAALITISILLLT